MTEKRRIHISAASLALLLLFSLLASVETSALAEDANIGGGGSSKLNLPPIGESTLIWRPGEVPDVLMFHQFG